MTFSNALLGAVTCLMIAVWTLSDLWVLGFVIFAVHAINAYEVEYE